MSYLHDLAARRPDLFTEKEREKLLETEFKKWAADITRQAQEAQDRVVVRPSRLPPPPPPAAARAA